MNKKIFCKNCGEDWGVTALISGVEWLCIKIRSFVLEFPGEDQPRKMFKRWKDLPFGIKEASMEDILKHSCDKGPGDDLLDFNFDVWILWNIMIMFLLYFKSRFPVLRFSFSVLAIKETVDSWYESDKVFKNFLAVYQCSKRLSEKKKKKHEDKYIKVVKWVVKDKIRYGSF